MNNLSFKICKNTYSNCMLCFVRSNAQLISSVDMSCSRLHSRQRSNLTKCIRKLKHFFQYWFFPPLKVWDVTQSILNLSTIQEHRVVFGVEGEKTVSRFSRRLWKPHEGIQPARIVGLQTKRRLHLLIPHSPEGWKVSGIATYQHAHQEKNTLTKNDLRCVGKL